MSVRTIPVVKPAEIIRGVADHMRFIELRDFRDCDPDGDHACEDLKRGGAHVHA